MHLAATSVVRALAPAHLPSALSGAVRKRPTGRALHAVVAAVREPGKPGSVAPFEEAKDFVWKLGLKEKEEWWEWERSGQRPGDIPSHPDRMYSEEGWDGWDDWLGVGKGGAHVEEFRPFNEARSFVHTLGLRNLRDWNLWSGSGQRPVDIPWRPDHAYANEWQDWEDWLGCE